MLELLAAAIIQITFLSSSPVTTADSQQTVSTTTATTTSNVDHGVGGWGDNH